MKKITETYLLDCSTADIPVPHDCEIRDIREENDCLIIDFEDEISNHDSIQALHPDARTLTMRFHLEYGGQNGTNKAYGGLDGIYRHRRRKFLRRESYLAVKNLQELRKLMKRCSFAPTYLYHYAAYHCIIAELCVNDSTLLMIDAGSVTFEWTVDEPAAVPDHADGK